MLPFVTRDSETICLTVRRYYIRPSILRRKYSDFNKNQYKVVIKQIKNNIFTLLYIGDNKFIFIYIDYILYCLC